MEYGNSIETAARVIGVSRRKIYDLINAGELETIRIGRRRLVTDRQIEEFFARKRRVNASHQPLAR